MKKLLLPAGLLMIGYVAVSSLSGAAARGDIAPHSAASECPPAYVVGCERDRVAVYRLGELYVLTDTPASSLPKRDRERLLDGIEVYSDRELKELLEDLCS